MMKMHFDITPFICAEDFEPEESVDELYADVKQSETAMDMFENSLYRLSKNGVEKAVGAFGKAAYSATLRRFNTSKVISTYGKLGKRWTDFNPESEKPDVVEFALTLNDISYLHRRKRYDDSIAKIEELLEDYKPDENNTEAEGTPENNTEAEVENDAEAATESNIEAVPENSAEDENNVLSKDHKIRILQHYLAIINIDKRKNEELRQKHDEDPMLIELAEQIKKEIRVMIDNWNLDGAENALNQMAKMAPFDPDIEDLRDEISDRKINYMNYM